MVKNSTLLSALIAFSFFNAASRSCEDQIAAVLQLLPRITRAVHCLPHVPLCLLKGNLVSSSMRGALFTPYLQLLVIFNIPICMVPQ